MESGDSIDWLLRGRAERAILAAIPDLASIKVYTSHEFGRNYLPAKMVQYEKCDGVPKSLIERTMRTMILDKRISYADLGKRNNRHRQFGLIVGFNPEISAPITCADPK